MTSLLEGAKKLVTRSSDIGARVDGLERAATAARGRVDDAVVDDAEKVADRAAGRLKLSADHTVVALAGATGSGKSSTFNALSGLELAAVGVRRPTTSWATACVWGKEGAEELLEWLGIPARHQVTRDSMLSTGRRGRRAARRRAARPPRPRLHRGLPPPRGRAPGAARRHAGVGARPAEVRRRRHPRPLPQAAGGAPRRDAGGAQPHRHRAGGPARLDDRRRTPPARGRRPGRRPGARRERAPRLGRRRAARHDRRARRGQEGHPLAARGRRQERRPAPPGGHRHRQGADACRRSGSPPSTTPSPRRPACRPS